MAWLSHYEHGNREMVAPWKVTSFPSSFPSSPFQLTHKTGILISPLSLSLFLSLLRRFLALTLPSSSFYSIWFPFPTWMHWTILNWIFLKAISKFDTISLDLVIYSYDHLMPFDLALSTILTSSGTFLSCLNAIYVRPVQFLLLLS